LATTRLAMCANELWLRCCCPSGPAAKRHFQH
jgi:hypothetical protein